MSGPIRSVLVAGGGTVGWAAAAALKRHLPRLDVTLLAEPPAADALADRLACALPSLPAFLGDLGIGAEDGIGRAGSGLRLGTAFAGWTGEGGRYVHAYGPAGRPFGPTSFHLHWLRADRDGHALPFDRYSAAAALAEAGRTPPPGPAHGIERGLALTPDRFRAMLRAFARHVGVVEATTPLVGVERAGDRIASVRVAGGGALSADLFVDATGPAARLRATLDGGWEDWRRWLMCDRLLLAEAPPAATPPLAEVTAVAAGWRWRASSPARTERGVAFASAFMSDEEAAALLPGDAGTPLAIGAGGRPDPWRGNCLALGEAAVRIDPLEWCPLHLALSGIDRLVALMPDRAFAPVELAEYNRQTLAEARRARDFVAAHYLTARRPEPFWRAAAAVEPPDSLARTLRLFRERGRLPFFPEETFSRDSWATILIGQGVRPRRIDPVTDLVAEPEAAAALAAIAAALRPHAPRSPATP